MTRKESKVLFKVLFYFSQLNNYCFSLLSLGLSKNF